MSTRKKMTVAAIVLIAAVMYLAVTGMKKGWVYFLAVDEFLADDSYHAQRVRLHGTVATDDAFSFSTTSLTANFTLLGKDKSSLPVAYRGPIPDMFEAGCDVVVEGKLDEARVFHADVLMTKCASKYEADSPHQKDPHNDTDKPSPALPRASGAGQTSDKEQRS